MSQQNSLKNSDQNLHENFLDLNPKFEKIRKERAIKKRVELIKFSIQNRAREIFNNLIRNGHELSFQDLRTLNKDWKDDYIKYQLFQDEQVVKYSLLIGDKGSFEHDLVNQEIWEVEDVQQKWDDFMIEFKNVIDKKAREFGYLSKKDLQKMFREFQIEDMTLKIQNQCWSCKRGIKCQKHGLIKRNILKTQDDFNGKNQNNSIKK